MLKIENVEQKSKPGQMSIVIGADGSYIGRDQGKLYPEEGIQWSFGSHFECLRLDVSFIFEDFENLWILNNKFWINKIESAK